MKLISKQLDNLIRAARGKRAVEKMVGQSKRFHYERYRLSDGSLLHLSTKRGRVTLTDASLRERSS
jgi:hypothetical protein